MLPLIQSNILKQQEQISLNLLSELHDRYDFGRLKSTKMAYLVSDDRTDNVCKARQYKQKIKKIRRT